jgi:hypothetical protein
MSLEQRAEELSSAQRLSVYSALVLAARALPGLPATWLPEVRARLKKRLTREIRFQSRVSSWIRSAQAETLVAERDGVVKLLAAVPLIGSGSVELMDANLIELALGTTTANAAIDDIAFVVEHLIDIAVRNWTPENAQPEFVPAKTVYEADARAAEMRIEWASRRGKL